MATFRVVDEDGDWYETDGDPAERFERMRARAVKAEGERDEAIIRAEDIEAEAARLQQHADWAKDGRDAWYERAKGALAEIDAVAAALIAAGITYPLGARGVRDLANQRDGQQERAEEAEAERDDLRELLGSIWLYADWRAVTRRLTTEQKELWADAVDAKSMARQVADGYEPHPVADRWWRDDA